MTSVAAKAPINIAVRGTSEIDVVSCLSPTADLDNLVTKSIQAYKKVKTASNNLLVKSSLELDAFKNPSLEDGTPSMRELIINGVADFTSFAHGEIDLCNNLKAYSSLLTQIVPELTIGE